MKEIFQVLNRMQAERVIGKYAIGGAVGATFYLEPASTLDLDIFVELESSPNSTLLTLTPIYDGLISRGYRAENEFVIIGGWPVQFLPPSGPLDKEALEEAASTEVEGVKTWVMPAEYLVAIALKTSRPKDFARILQFVEAGILDSGRLDDILRRHGLLEKWEQFGIKFLRGDR